MQFFSFAATILLFLQFVLSFQDSQAPKLLSWSDRENGDTVEPTLTLIEQPYKARAPQRIMNDSLGVAVTARASMVIDTASDTVLWEKNPDEERPLASITKLASVLVALEALENLEEEIEVLDTDYVNLGNNVFTVGDVVRLRDVVAAALIASDNTAAQILVRATGMPTESFVQRMNSRAHELNLEHTKFVDVTGLSSSNVSTAREIVQIARTAFTHQTISRYVGKRSYSTVTRSGQQRLVVTTNMLIGGMVHIVAGKTGYVSESGFSFIGIAERDGHELLGVVLGSATNEDRFQDFKMLVHWAWENFTWSEH